MSAGTRETDYFGGSGGGGVTDYSNTASSPGSFDPRYGGGSVSPGGGHPGGDRGTQQQMQRYRFSPEEMKSIRECNRESFYYRCLPIGTIMGLGAYYGVRHGYLKPSPRFGAGPKITVASIIGYFIGKFSYQHVCAEKLMALPNSQLGEILRKQKGRMGFQETFSMEPGFATVAPVGAPAFPNSDFNQSSSNVYSDVGDTRPMTGFDSDVSSGVTGYDYSQTSPSNYDTTQQMLNDENLPPKRVQSLTTYDDLRRQNRIDYESRQHNRYQPLPPTVAPESSRGSVEGSGYYDSRRSQPSYQPGDGLAKPKNKYGDVWDEKPGNY